MNKAFKKIGQTKIKFFFCITIFAFSSSHTNASSNMKPTRAPDVIYSKQTNIKKQYIVTFKQPITASVNTDSTIGSVTSLANNMVNQYGVELLKTYDFVDSSLMVITPAQMKQLKKDSNIKAIEANNVIKLPPPMESINAENEIDWGLDRIDQHYLPLNRDYHFDYTGNNVNAYIIDTGIYKENTDFNDRVHSGYNAFDMNNDISDCHGHGTHVAGLMGSETYGVAKNVALYGIKVLNCKGEGPTSVILDGIDWVIKNAIQPAVANFSLGGSTSQVLDNAIEALINAGISVAIAAGNNNDDACNYSPRTESALLVGSTDKDDNRSSFSNWGACIDIFAPGENRRSTFNTSPSATKIYKGTSMSAPTVAGTMALILEQYPDFSPQQVKETLLFRSTKGQINALDSDSPNKLVYTLDDLNDKKPPPSDCDNQCLQNDVAAIISDEVLHFDNFYIDVPQGASNLQIQTYDGSGNLSLYVRYGSQPSGLKYDCSHSGSKTTSQCEFPYPSEGRWHIMTMGGLKGYSNVKLKASYLITP